MSAQTLHFYLPPWLHDRLDQPSTIFARVVQAVQIMGWQLALHGEDDAPARDGYHLLYNRPVTRPNTLVLRKCGFEPFFRIEATNDRWDWGVAKSDFATDKGGEWFRSYWQGELFRGHTITKGGYAFVPLQGKLLEQRHFQAASPKDMIALALKSDPNMPLRATLHPRETYSDEERVALAEIQKSSGGQFALSDQPSIALLAGCDYVVTQNSTLALIGMFAQKPPILFAEIDFHHIAESVPHIGLQRAYKRLHRPRKWGAYLHWYFKENAITQRDEDAPAQIAARFKALGWSV